MYVKYGYETFVIDTAPSMSWDELTTLLGYTLSY
jgi:hypothetical protein